MCDLVPGPLLDCIRGNIGGETRHPSQLEHEGVKEKSMERDEDLSRGKLTEWWWGEHESDEEDVARNGKGRMKIH